MLTIRVIPCLDVRDGRVVKGVRFQNLRDAGSPEERAAEYESQGADELVVLDVAATPEARAASFDTVRRVRRSICIPLTVGGGVRTIEHAEALLEAGADKIAVNTAAVQHPELLAALADRFGSQCTVLALDAALVAPGRWTVVTHSGRIRTGMDALEWATAAQRLGVGEILLTSWDRDGTGSGYDLVLIRAMSETVRVPVIASGGAASPDDLIAATRAGADALLAASIFHDGHYTVAEVKRALAAAQVKVRT